MPAAGDNEPAACYLEVLALTPRLGKAFLDLRHNNFFSVRAGAERMIADTIAMTDPQVAAWPGPTAAIVIGTIGRCSLV